MAQSVSNAVMLARVCAGASAFAIIGFVCGYFGPLYLLPDAGVGPMTGFFMTPVGVLVGVASTVWASATAASNSAFAARVLVVAAVFAVAILVLVVAQ